MKIKKNYLKPDVKVHQVKPTTILAGSDPQTQQANEQYEETTPEWTWQ